MGLCLISRRGVCIVRVVPHPKQLSSGELSYIARSLQIRCRSLNPINEFTKASGEPEDAAGRKACRRRHIVRPPSSPVAGRQHFEWIVPVHAKYITQIKIYILVERPDDDGKPWRAAREQIRPTATATGIAC